MFGLFRKKATPFPVTDKIYMSSDAKERAMVSLLRQDTNVVFVYWFQESYERSLTALGEQNNNQLYMSREAGHARMTGKRIIFYEHYPLPEKEKELFERMGLHKAEVWTALDEPLLKIFGGDRIVAMMQQMGMQENEVIEHSLVTRSLRNAQDKVSKKNSVDRAAHSMEAWFRNNEITR